MPLFYQFYSAIISLSRFGWGKGAGLAAALLLLALTTTASAALVNQKISGTMPAFGDIEIIPFLQISPDGQTVVYVADQETDEAFELWRVPIDGSSPPLRLSGLLPSGTKIDEFAISPDSSRVVYLAEQDTLGILELYSVPLTGGAATKLNGPLVSGGNVSSFQISPDSSRVVYQADQQTENVRELYSVPLAGGTTTKLNGVLVSGGFIGYVLISPDSSRVVYLADQEINTMFELFVTFDRPPEINFERPAVAVTEAAGTASVAVQLSEPALDPVQVDYAVSGGSAAGNGQDYDLSDGTLLFAPSVISQPLTISLIDDPLGEADETIVVSLSNPQNGVLAAPSVFTLTIQDNDGGPAPADFMIHLPAVLKP